nr:MAG TPA: hypothetical protein [Bacteriophage sp.]
MNVNSRCVRPADCLFLLLRPSATAAQLSRLIQNSAARESR